MVVSDEMVIAALIQDAKRFKSKWELHTSKPTRSKPNVVFLKRTLSNVVKVNNNLMRKSQKVEIVHSALVEPSKQEESGKNSVNARESRTSTSKNLKGCSKYQSPEITKSKSPSQQKRKK